MRTILVRGGLCLAISAAIIGCASGQPTPTAAPTSLPSPSGAVASPTATRTAGPPPTWEGRTEAATPTRTASPPPPMATVAPGFTATALPTTVPAILSSGALPEGARERIGLGEIRAAELSPDGQLIAIGTAALVAVARTDTLDVLWTTSMPAPVEGVTWSWDGMYLGVWLWWADQRYVVLDAQSGDEIYTGVVPGRVQGAAWTPSGAELAVGYGEWGDVAGGVEIFNVLTHTPRTLWQAEHDIENISWAYAVAWSPDGMLIAASMNDDLGVWDSATGEQVLAAPVDAHDGIRILAFNPQGTLLAAATNYGGGDSVSGDWRVFVVDVTTGDVNTFTHTEYTVVTALAWSPDGTALVAGTGHGCPTSEPSELTQWDVLTGERHSFDVTELFSDVGDVEWSPDGKHVAALGHIWPSSGPGVYSLAIWDSASEQLGQSIPLDACCRYRIDWLPDSRRLLTSSEDAVILWNVPDGEVLQTLDGATSLGQWVWSNSESSLPPNVHPDVEGVWRSEWSPDGSMVAVYDYSSNTTVYDADTMTPLRTWEISNPSIAWSPDSTRLALQAGPLIVWSVEGEEWMLPAGGFGALEWSPDGTRLASAVGLGTATAGIFDAATGERVVNLSGIDGSILDFTWSPDGTRIAAGSTGRGAPGNDGYGYVYFGNKVTVFDAITGETLYGLEGHPVHVYAVGWSPDGALLATAGGKAAYGTDAYTDIGGYEENRVMIWDGATGALRQVFRGHNGGVDSLLWSPDSRSLASGSVDGTILIWNIAP